MQNRMKKHQLTSDQIVSLFNRAHIGTLATLNSDGFPYAIAMHFVYLNEKIYLHGLPKGQKIDNIIRNPKVCFEINEMLGLIASDTDPCDTNTEYNSIVALGYAKIVDDLSLKREVLNKIINKFTPNFSGYDLPENMVKGTAVIEIEIKECTGKYYK
ncbi:pyridoxamine 5'-phosphate oxidase-like protein, FMN-binding protein [Gottschalkia acidurici 9a]|uniref:Pyridoxamine 5'-phosphate oxidase-like protein, FMN-binding protein n=1 Tax=Gottschalkia acidurici (strain ATCC 7906 / DSM 604 / BCRC 14475 / CIP 104303 / KCTC 5404 / NCIMB 10678 / 9a) TaxID=1128398 RepID=K0AVY9_GOTA9|nr:pyridoxamine 5'-phosphate oxidase family protein [Gottschalkia acidurici]AFS77409.1 pyridoxamine 5'-phosphate oxidase-like protein, FMN-binding protein [Gottschalkia acidurici 9a]